jgi:hypothetical protein
LFASQTAREFSPHPLPVGADWQEHEKRALADTTATNQMVQISFTIIFAFLLFL